MNVEVVTYSKSPQKWFDTPAAVYVITQEDIRRSGVTNIPEALRMAPGVEVYRVNANQWVVGIRGFTSLTGRLSPSLLVLIDGRSVYSPLLAGVFWEVQDLLLEDVERIEVIRGPGGTLWGANAVNGVINIITKHSKETQGGLATLGAGTEERDFAGVRYGGAVGERLHYRVYGKFFNRDAAFHPTGDAFDDWRMAQGGFRADLDLPERNTVTIQGDLYSGKAGQRTTITTYRPPSAQTMEKDADLSGGNLSFRLDHLQSAQSDWTFKSYYDRTRRRTSTFQDDENTLDLELRNRFLLAAGHELIWGIGYRLISDDFTGASTTVFDPAQRTDALYSAFAQYQWALVQEQLFLTLGSKFEHNDYSGVEVQPSGRLLWKFRPDQAVWTSIARAVRTPSRLEHDSSLTGLTNPNATPPTFIRLIGEDALFDSEKVIAYEVGYRTQPIHRLSFDVAAFYNQYSDLLSLQAGAPFTESIPPDPDRVIFPFFFENRVKGHTYGVELMSDWQVREWWRVNLMYTFLQINLTQTSGAVDPLRIVASTEGTNPHHQAGLRSLMTLPGNVELDWFLRYIDKLPSQAIKRYYNLDLHLGWHPTKWIELALVGQNLLDNHHPEFGGGSAGIAEIQRGVYGKVTAQWQ
ncbi:MAG: TonB-dependent receptor [Nitrospirae bacterium]|nr:TonB-dependent receptor [Candidatus Manganitrophaceae bacterium]